MSLIEVAALGNRPWVFNAFIYHPAQLFCGVRVSTVAQYSAAVKFILASEKKVVVRQKLLAQWFVSLFSHYVV